MTRALAASVTHGGETEAELVLIEAGDELGTIRIVLDNGDEITLDAVEVAALIAGLHDD